jgi:mannose-6-phosphate isomerase
MVKAATQPVRLPSASYYRIWGTAETEPWYRNFAHQVIGEVWFQASDAVPLLVKFLFTSDRLSVQVHPPDAYAMEHHGSRGKTEMWHILRAEPEAAIALGLRVPVTKEQLRAAAESGEIVDLLNWIPVRPGETYFIPAGTIHAIGGGIVICEVQQLSDITYRLYDYQRLDKDGNPRELHLDHSVAVARLEPGGAAQEVQCLEDGRELLVDSEYFRTERLVVKGRATVPARHRNQLCIALEGGGEFGDQPFAAGETWEIPAGQGVEISSPSAVFLITSAPPTAAPAEPHTNS